MPPMIKAGISNSPSISNHIDKRPSPFSTVVATTMKTAAIGRENEIEKPSLTNKSATKKTPMKHHSSSSDVKEKEILSTASSIPAVVSTEERRVKGDGAADATSTSYEEDEKYSVSLEVMIPLKQEEGSESFAYADEADSRTNDGYHADDNSISSSQRRKPARTNGHGIERGRHQTNSHKRRSQSHKSASSQEETATSDMSMAVRSHNVCKVIKGEIHNVLNIMRSDPRCASPLRFVEEMPTDEQHPLLLRFRELHRSMTEWELRHGYDGTSRQQLHQPEARLYLPPFCVAIQSRDISAKVTGAALQSLQKFLLFGFLSAEGPNAFATIANTLLLCTFEESSSFATNHDGVNSGSRGEPSIIGRLPAGRSGSNTPLEVTYAGRDDDEQVVLRLLDLSALIVRSASTELKPDVVVGLLDICLHVSHRAKRASGLLKSAASDAMKQIVLEVFSKPNLARKREEILAKLASLLNPKQNSDAYVVNSLTLVNFALETLTPERLTNVEIGILKKELCAHLLNWSTSHDLVILSLTMRIIFNLFQTIRNHLKVPLEVFLTSVHLRILEHSRNSEEREVALESLLEFCREPALIKDLYLNYDCDVQCTNLYANICTTLANVAAPLTYGAQEDIMNGDSSGSNNHAKRMNGGGSSIAHKAAIAASEVPMNILNVLALESLLTIIESIARRCKNHSQHQEDGGVHNISTNTNTNLATTSNKSSRFKYSSSGSVDLDDDLEMSEEDLQERKRRKAALSRVAAAFNVDHGSKEWIKIGKESHVLEETPESVALALYTAPGLNKDQLGTYLGKGPVEKYPFIHKVRLAFVTHFDFSNCGRFASALRTFLHKFRLPGEAQQIDRLMDAFSKEYYKQQGKKSVFKNSDAVFVLAFSTIMLNTDLHNPNIKNKKKMTRQQFIRNNRGINKGSDLPEAMLAWLYTDIREHELQVQREIGEFISHSDALDAEHFRGAWGDMLRKNVAVAVFTSADEARKSMFEAGVHEKDMFIAICKPALRSISSAFVRSWDDGNIVAALKGLEQMAKISTFFALDDVLNEILSFLLAQGRDYIIGCVALEYSGIESGAPISQENDDEDTMATMSIVDPDSPVPYSLLRVREIAYVDTKKTDINGAAAYRGLLALNMGLRIVRTLFPRVRSAWPQLIEVFGCLRDARALPAGLSDLDDFADSDGNVLPLSLFARNSQGRLDEIYSLKAGKKGNTKQGWFRGVFARARIPEEEGAGGMQAAPSNQWRTSKIPKNSRILLQVAEWTEVEKFMVLGPHLRLQLVQQSLKGLLQSIDKIPSKPSPTFEQHQAFALELATRALLNSDDRAQVLFPIFLSKFNSVAQKLSKLKRPIPVPFLMERVVVTILRSSIHLYHIPAVSFCVQK
jgi:brefeldin A-resistance guanine nucleotide exchange factor 1